MTFSIVTSTADAAEFLRKMLAAAAYWREPSIPADVDRALARRDLSGLLADWGHADDVALIAELDGARVGAAWFRTCVRSYGYVADDVPELGIGVEPEMRSRGVGTMLLNGLIEEARSRRFRELSLSVELENPARQLYQKLGFRDHDRTDNAATMVLNLDTKRAEH